MGKTFKVYKNYGCLAAEKRVIYTAENPQPTATVSDEIEVTVPDGWKLDENEFGSLVVTAPWGWTYTPNELLQGNENPYFAGIDKDRNEFRIKLDWHQI